MLPYPISSSLVPFNRSNNSTGNMCRLTWPSDVIHQSWGRHFKVWSAVSDSCPWPLLIGRRNALFPKLINKCKGPVVQSTNELSGGGEEEENQDEELVAAGENLEPNLDIEPDLSSETEEVTPTIFQNGLVLLHLPRLQTPRTQTGVNEQSDFVRLQHTDSSLEYAFKQARPANDSYYQERNSGGVKTHTL
ncbi:CCKAR protein, partial [Polypterus senegalus]